MTLTCVSVARCHYIILLSICARAAVILRNLLVVDVGKNEHFEEIDYPRISNINVYK